MRKIIILCTFIVPLCLFTACNRQHKIVASVTTEAIPVDASLDSIQDTAYITHLAPYKEALEREMNTPIGYAPERLWVAAPECPMLNWASDALWNSAKQVYPGNVDLAVVNIGGMRCDWLPGPVTKGSVFELMPFDNQLVVLTLSGADLMELCESFVRCGGQGVAGLRLKAVDGMLAEVTIGGKVLETDKNYTVATSDYLAGGTDHMEALARYTDRWNSGLLIRDLYLRQVEEQDTIRAAVDGRMTIL